MVKPICLDPASAASRGVHATFDMAGDVLGHHDRIVDHEAGRDGERHQGEIVEAEAQEIHYRESAGEGERRCEARNEGGARVAQKHENHQHDE